MRPRNGTLRVESDGGVGEEGLSRLSDAVNADVLVNQNEPSAQEVAVVYHSHTGLCCPLSGPGCLQPPPTAGWKKKFAVPLYSLCSGCRCQGVIRLPGILLLRLGVIRPLM